ncbi:GTPase HflX, partial [Candidatus Bathyarchaeota archaeon]|nr:GTPase HflX [Candidatus Bathyarchaeota archaeon]
SVSLAGYTNAGKTTLFNILVKESKPVNLDLFTTLSTTTRSVNFKGKRVLLTDTVGFIDRLPLVLVESFHSTLEETILADVIILVVDIHEPIEEVKKKLDVCLSAIREIGAGATPIITAFNKADMLTKEELEERMRIIEQQAPNPVVISALKAMKLGELEQSLANHLGNYLKVTFILPINDLTLSFLSELHDQVGVLETLYEGKQIKVVVHASPWFMNKIHGQVKKLKGRLLESYEIEE